MTIDDIVKEFITSTQREYINQSFIEENCPAFGVSRFGIKHSAGSYSRRFRAIKDSINGVDLEEVTQDEQGNNFKWKTWKIKPQLTMF